MPDLYSQLRIDHPLVPTVCIEWLKESVVNVTNSRRSLDFPHLHIGSGGNPYGRGSLAVIHANTRHCVGHFVAFGPQMGTDLTPTGLVLAGVDWFATIYSKRHRTEASLQVRLHDRSLCGNVRLSHNIGINPVMGGNAGGHLTLPSGAECEVRYGRQFGRRWVAVQIDQRFSALSRNPAGGVNCSGWKTLWRIARKELPCRALTWETTKLFEQWHTEEPLDEADALAVLAFAVLVVRVFWRHDDPG